MEFVFHIGAHCTDEGAVLNALAMSRGKLQNEGIILPYPARYRPVLRETIQALRGAPAPPEAQQLVLDSILNDDHPDRVVFSNDSAIVGYRNVTAQNLLYPIAHERTAQYRAIFPSDEVEFCIGLRNPATFLPACFARSQMDDFNDFLSGSDPLLLRWSELVARIARANPDCLIRVWSNEDTPFIWEQILRAISGVSTETQLNAVHDFAASLLNEEGARRFKTYIRKTPPRSAQQYQRAVAAFLDRFAAPEAQDIVLDIPGWSPDFVEAVTEIYEEDLYAIERMSGVEFISP